MPDTLARLYMFRSGRDAQKFVCDIKNAEGKNVRYGSIRLANQTYDLNKEIGLIVRVEAKRVSKLLETGEEYYRFNLDIPVFHMSLEGEFRVKETRNAL
ncbi:hypothetical protein apy_08880 [Aeropyrum pernix]|uniref:Uncharacterized protein n=1 Tax=Aeropyrum pernix TaxID=56636 RepID=A0A401H9T9_AERPX|nr:hypothetical protein [Aeropyrum pernix]GBF09163.1 hypothetical protein apy_08880 [Aeropyrum pernix]